jgi:hypothetical protein
MNMIARSPTRRLQDKFTPLQMGHGFVTLVTCASRHCDGRSFGRGVKLSIARVSTRHLLVSSIA